MMMGWAIMYPMPPKRQTHTERRAAEKAAARRRVAERIASGEITPAQAQFDAAPLVGPVVIMDMMGDLRRHYDRGKPSRKRKD